MANSSSIRLSRAQEGLPVSDGSSASPSAFTKRKCYNLMPLLVALGVLSEIAFLGRLDMPNNAAFFNSWPGFFHTSRPSPGESCEEWLERADAIVSTRDFDKDPVWVYGTDKQGWQACSVGCRFGRNPSGIHDAAFTLSKKFRGYHVLRSMESSKYYSQNNISQARRLGFDVIMTTSLSSDVPVGYFSWAEYDFMAPLKPKTEKALAAAFISNCDAQNFRMQAFSELKQANVTIDSYGICYRNRDGRVDKVETLKRYRFSLAFENSNEEDYVTEKFFQSLVAGTIPVVVGAPNIEDFAPWPHSFLHIKELDDVKSVAKRMKYLAENLDAYNHSLRSGVKSLAGPMHPFCPSFDKFLKGFGPSCLYAICEWKYEGPSDSFKALVDMAAVHSSCRLCIHLATKIRETEEKSAKRPCKCRRGLETVYHLYVRERGRFKLDSIFLRSEDLTLAALESAVLKKVQSEKHDPVWKQGRPESLKGGGELKVYKIYPVGLTQRQALYEFRFDGDSDLKTHIQTNPCAKFEVIFV